MTSKFPYKTALITGGNGNIGRLISEKLVQQGVRVIRFDIPGSEPVDTHALETIVVGDIRDTVLLQELFQQYQPDIVYHLASLLSGSSEADIEAAWEINATASFKLMQLATAHGTQTFFFASTIASYGSDLTDPMHEEMSQWPENFYGVTKVAVERIGVYFKQKHNLDFRCLRFPMVISPFAPPSAVTAYPSHAFKAAVSKQKFVFPVSKDTGMSTLFLEDVINSIMLFSNANVGRLKRHAYSLHAYYFTAEEIVEKIVERYPHFDYRYEPVKEVEHLLSSWPNVIVDDYAQNEWGWQPEYDFNRSAEWMFDYFSHLENRP